MKLDDDLSNVLSSSLIVSYQYSPIISYIITNSSLNAGLQFGELLGFNQECDNARNPFQTSCHNFTCEIMEVSYTLKKKKKKITDSRVQL